MTEDSQGVTRGDGPSRDEAERTVQIAGQRESSDPPEIARPEDSSRLPSAGEHPAPPGSADPGSAAPTSATPDFTPPAGAPQSAATPAATQDAIPAATQDAIPAATQGAIPAATHSETPAATQGATPAATDGAIPAASQGATPAATDGAIPAASQGATPAATDGAIPAASQGETPAAPHYQAQQGAGPVDYTAQGGYHPDAAYGHPDAAYGPVQYGHPYQTPPAWSSAPTSGAAAPDPVSGGAVPGPTSGAELASGGPASYDSWAADPVSGGAGGDRYGFASSPSWNRPRIEPSPPPDRSRLIVGILAGLVAGLVLFGAAGWFVGRATAPESAPVITPTSVIPAPGLGAYEQSQLVLNQSRFAGTALAKIDQAWLPHLANCARSGASGGPALNTGEKVRIRCTFDGMSMIFVEYHTIADRDRAQVTTLGQNVDARTLTPGVGAAGVRGAPSGRTNGNYVEYAYRLPEGGTARTIAGLWWDDAPTPVAAYLLAYWKEGLGESWVPMRDLWARYA